MTFLKWPRHSNLSLFFLPVSPVWWWVFSSFLASGHQTPSTRPSSMEDLRWLWKSKTWKTKTKDKIGLSWSFSCFSPSLIDYKLSSGALLQHLASWGLPDRPEPGLPLQAAGLAIGHQWGRAAPGRAGGSDWGTASGGTADPHCGQHQQRYNSKGPEYRYTSETEDMRKIEYFSCVFCFFFAFGVNVF